MYMCTSVLSVSTWTNPDNCSYSEKVLHVHLSAAPRLCFTHVHVHETSNIHCKHSYFMLFVTSVLILLISTSCSLRLPKKTL